MNQSDKIIHWLNSGIFPASILFSVGFTYDEIIKYCNKVKAHGWTLAISEDKELLNSGKNFALKRTVTNNKTGKEVDYFYIIFLERFDFSDWSMCKLAHEVLHICQFMLPDILNRNKEFECEAYLHTHIMEQALKIMRQK